MASQWFRSQQEPENLQTGEMFWLDLRSEREEEKEEEREGEKLTDSEFEMGWVFLKILLQKYRKKSKRYPFEI